MGPGPLAGGLNPPGTAIQPTMLSAEKLGGAVVSAAAAGQSAAAQTPAVTHSKQVLAIQTLPRIFTVVMDAAPFRPPQSQTKSSAPTGRPKSGQPRAFQ